MKLHELLNAAVTEDVTKSLKTEASYTPQEKARMRAAHEYNHELQKHSVAEGRDELQAELKTINQQLKDAFEEYKKNHQMHPDQYMKKVKELKDRREELIKQLRDGVAENNSVMFKTGDKVTVKNAKKYDSMATADKMPGVVDFIWPDGRIAVTVKVGKSTGQMNVDAGDLTYLQEAADPKSPEDYEELARKHTADGQRGTRSGMVYASMMAGRARRAAKILKDGGSQEAAWRHYQGTDVAEASYTAQEKARMRAAHEYNLDAAQREIDRRSAEGEDMTGATIDQNTYEIIKPKKKAESVYATDSEKLKAMPDLPVVIHKSPYEGAEVGEYTEIFVGSPKTAQQFAKYIIFKGGSARLGKRGQDIYVYHKGAGPITKRDFRMAKLEEGTGDPEEGWCVVSSDRPRIVIDGPHLDRETALKYKQSVSPAQSSGWFVLWGKEASDGSGEYVATRAVNPAEEVKEGFSEDDLAVGGTIIYKANDQYRMSELVTKLAGRKLKLMNGATCDLADVVSTDESDWPRFRDMKVTTQTKTEVAEAAYADDLDPNKPIIVKGFRGMQSKPFKKRFKNMDAFEAWLEDDGDDVQQDGMEVTNESVKEPAHCFIEVVASVGGLMVLRSGEHFSLRAGGKRYAKMSHADWEHLAAAVKNRVTVTVGGVTLEPHADSWEFKDAAGLPFATLDASEMDQLMADAGAYLELCSR